MKRQLIGCAAAAIALFLGGQQASAHTIIIGYTPGANAGEVNLWLGSYHGDNLGDGPNIEGSARLVGPNSYDTTTAFTYGEGVTSNEFGTQVVAPPPAGLIYGTNLFTSQDFANSYTGGNPAGVVDWANSWQGVTISGLAAGTYTFSYVPIANPTAHWAPWADLQSVQLTLTAGDTGGGGTNVGAVPEPASLALAAFGAVAALARRRRSA